MNLFQENDAEFSLNRKHRFYLSRIWDKSKPILMFIGLNPSKADEESNDKTISKLERISRFNQAGGFYMLNLFTFVSTDPDKLETRECDIKADLLMIAEKAKLCDKVVFAWGDFKQAKGRDNKVIALFKPPYWCLQQNKKGTPKHPLFCLDRTIVKEFHLSLIL